MYTLAFDTTASACSIALTKDEKIISKFYKEMEFGQSETLIPEIKNILEAQNLKIKDLSAIAVCVGPGSFTGVRASISAARAFGIACPELKIVGINAFDGYLKELYFDEIADINAVIIETKREDFYFQLFDAKLNKICEPQTGFYDDIVALLRNKKVSLVGDGVERFLFKPTGLSIHCLKMSRALPIENLVQCLSHQIKEKTFNYPKPLYLRAPDVCIKKS